MLADYGEQTVLQHWIGAREHYGEQWPEMSENEGDLANILKLPLRHDVLMSKLTEELRIHVDERELMLPVPYNKDPQAYVRSTQFRQMILEQGIDFVEVCKEKQGGPSSSDICLQQQKAIAKRTRGTQ